MSASQSLSEARQTFELLKQSEEKIGEILDKRHDITQMRVDTQDLVLLLRQAMSLMGRLGVGENLVQAYRYIMQIIVAINSMRTAILALQMGMGPIGWLSLAIGAMSMGIAITGAPELRDELETEVIF